MQLRKNAIGKHRVMTHACDKVTRQVGMRVKSAILPRMNENNGTVRTQRKKHCGDERDERCGARRKRTPLQRRMCLYTDGGDEGRGGWIVEVAWDGRAGFSRYDEGQGRHLELVKRHFWDAG